MNGLKDYYGNSDILACLIESLGWARPCFLGQALQYIVRAGKKPGNSFEEDIEKAIWCLERVIEKKHHEESSVGADVLRDDNGQPIFVCRKDNPWKTVEKH